MRNNKGWHLYLIHCSDNSLYTGITTDISRRIKEHNQKKGGMYTRNRTPVELVYQEPHPSKSSALKREIQIKKWPRLKKVKLIKEYRSSD
jgi:predicted GIY-YIG superfamily endonuclease